MFRLSDEIRDECHVRQDEASQNVIVTDASTGAAILYFAIRKVKALTECGIVDEIPG